MSIFLGFNDVNENKFDFWKKDWDDLTEEEKNNFCKEIGLKSREMEGEFMAIMSYQTHRKNFGLI
jgi:hypothetical protein